MSAPSTGPSPAPSIPKIHLLSMDPLFSKALTAACTSHSLSEAITSRIEHHIAGLHALPSSLTFSCIVSPANSYGILDGGFDDAISRYFSARDDYNALTRTVQASLYASHRGFLAPGACELVEIPEDIRARSKAGELEWGCAYVAICPTMRVPGDVRWDKEVVYECIWNLLCAIETHNRAISEGGSGGNMIDSILMAPMATGTGYVSEKKWAEQVVLALKHFEESGREKEKWSKLDWTQAGLLALAVTKTHSY